MLPFFLISFVLSSSSILLVASLLLSVIFSSYYFYFYFISSWMLVSVLLIYLGGVLVLFMYMSTLNYKKFLVNKKSFVLILPIFILWFLSTPPMSGEEESDFTLLSFMSSEEVSPLLITIILILTFTLILIGNFLGKSYLPFRIS